MNLKSFLSTWTLTRFLGLILGIYFFADFFTSGNFFGLFIGSIVLAQVIFNFGCFAGRCDVPAPQNRTNTTSVGEEEDLVTVEEIGEK